ncbi:MAG TPA: MBL fold metallo-hydrolase [Pyrinomonadaceae bacterium]|jgi:glyoxylase-like metal-dependent hydrolase (beta-lactamase superfamily II)
MFVKLCLVAAAIIIYPFIALSQTSKYEMVKIADGVYTSFQANPYAVPVEGNSTIIINERDVVVVDSNATPASARATLAEIRKLTDKPVRYVINSHWHDDHIFGNQVYMEAFPGVEFISHKNTREDFITQGGPKSLKDDQANLPKTIQDAEARLAAGKRRDGQPMTEQDRAFTADQIKQLKEFLPELAAVRPLPPTLTIESGLTLHRGERVIQILYLGKGNTRGDLVVYLPQEKVLMTGDLVVNPVPFSFGSYLGEWIQTLRKLRDFPAETIIPGHGPAQKNKEYISQLIELLESTLTQTQGAVKRGLNLEETRKAVNLESFRVRFAGEDRVRNFAFQQFFVTPAVERAWLEARGELDKPEAKP